MQEGRPWPQGQDLASAWIWSCAGYIRCQQLSVSVLSQLLITGTKHLSYTV